MAALWSFLKDPLNELFQPKSNMKCAGEALFLGMFIATLMTTVLKPELFDDNPVKAVLGYNNVCVTFDEQPMRFVITPFFTMSVFFGLLYCHQDTQAAKLRVLAGGSQTTYRVVLACNAFYAASQLCVPLILVINVHHHIMGHTAAFMQVIVARFVAVAGNYYEARMDGDFISAWSWRFLGVYAVLSFVLPVMTAVDMAVDTDKDRPVPPVLMQTLDYLWFLCLAITSKMLPASARIKVRYEVVAGTSDQVMPSGEVVPEEEWTSDVVNSKLLSHASMSSAAASIDKSELDKVPCPVVAMLLKHGLITPGADGRVLFVDIAKAVAQIGVGADIIASVFRVFQKRLTEEETAGGVDVFNLKATGLNHGWSTGIRDPTVSPEKLKIMTDCARPGGPDGELRIYKEHMYNARRIFSRLANEDPTHVKTRRMHITASMDLAMLLEVFGRLDTATGDRFLLPDDLHAIYIDSDAPEAWIAHRTHTGDIIGELLAIDCGCLTRCCAPDRYKGSANVHPQTDPPQVVVVDGD